MAGQRATYIALAGITAEAMGDVEEELLDVALMALAACEHVRGYDQRSLELLAEKLEPVLERARL